MRRCNIAACMLSLSCSRRPFFLMSRSSESPFSSQVRRNQRGWVWGGGGFFFVRRSSTPRSPGQATPPLRSRSQPPAPSLQACFSDFGFNAEARFTEAPVWALAAHLVVCPLGCIWICVLCFSERNQNVWIPGGPFDTHKSAPDYLGEVLERKRTRNSSAISRYSGAIFRNSGAIPKSVQRQSSALQSVRLHECLCLTLLAHLPATKARANICVAMAPTGTRSCLPTQNPVLGL